MTVEILCIGGGNMARALLQGLRSMQMDMQSVCVVEIDSHKQQILAQDFGVLVQAQLPQVLPATIILAVKPQHIQSVCRALSPTIKTSLLISLAAGISLACLKQWLGGYSYIVRAMPNTPAQIQAGVTVLCADNIGPARCEVAEHIFNTLGITLWLENEDLMNAVTAISGSGPAYVFYFLQAWVSAGVQAGLSPDMAYTLAVETFYGATQLVRLTQTDNPDKQLEALRQAVTSPSGTTAAGIAVLEQRELMQIMRDTIRAAQDRAQALGEEFRTNVDSNQ